jgi:hypothetical protein
VVNVHQGSAAAAAAWAVVVVVGSVPRSVVETVALSALASTFQTAPPLGVTKKGIARQVVVVALKLQWPVPLPSSLLLGQNQGLLLRPLLLSAVVIVVGFLVASVVAVIVVIVPALAVAIVGSGKEAGMEGMASSRRAALLALLPKRTM